MALKALLWVQFALMSGFGLFAVVIMSIEPPPTVFIWTAAVVLGLSPFGFAAATAINAARLERDPQRARRSITITQGAVMVHMGLGIGFITLMGMPGPPAIRLLLAVILVIAGLIFGLVRMGEPPRLTAGWTGPRNLRVTLVVQCGFMGITAMIAVWWWLYVLTAVEPRIVTTLSVSLTLAWVIPMTALLLAVLVMFTVNLARGSAVDASTRTMSLVGEQLWLSVVGLCTLPWFYDQENRLMPQAVDVPDHEAGMTLGWMIGGEFDVFNELGLWFLTASAIPAILAVVQYVRMPALPPMRQHVTTR